MPGCRTRPRPMQPAWLWGKIGDVALYDPSDAVIRPLMTAYWSSQGWREPPAKLDDDALDRLVRSGLMFVDGQKQSHDAWVAESRSAVREVEPAEVGAAFLTSLASHRLDLRSALGSFAVARHLPAHNYSPLHGLCRVCGLSSNQDSDRNVMSFERFKWAGVRRDDLTYVALDLHLFQRAPRLPLSKGDLILGRRLLDAIASAPPDCTAPKLARSLTFIKGNKDERRVLLEILAVAGVLEAPEHPGYRERFVDMSRREHTDAHFEDSTYPLWWLRGRHGVNGAAIREWFPDLFRPAARSTATSQPPARRPRASPHA